MIEDRLAANRLEVLDVAEKVAERLTDRRRKREKQEPQETKAEVLARGRAIYGVHAR